MLPQPSCSETQPGQICHPHSAADLAAEMDRLDTMYAAFDERIAEALRPEPVDWDRHYRELFAELAAIAHRVHAADGGA